MGAKEAIAVLAGGFYEDEKGEWRSSTFAKTDCGPLGSIVRVLAGSYLYKENPKPIIVSGSVGGDCVNILPQGLTSSAILKKELVELGVPAGEILEEAKGKKTHEQLIEIERMLRTLPFLRLKLVSSAHHLPRIEALLKYVPEIAALRNMSELVAAEAVVVKHDFSWKTIINEAYKTEPILRIIAQENQGILDIKRGKYRFE